MSKSRTKRIRNLTIKDSTLLLSVVINFVAIFVTCLHFQAEEMEKGDLEKGTNEKPEKAKSNHPSFNKNFLEYFSEYSDNTSIHGVRYLGEKKRSIVERLCWFVVLALSLYLCVVLIAETYEKWETSPVIVSFSRSPTPVWKVPFPSVTVCPETKTRQRVYNFTEEYHKMLEHPENMTEEEIKKFEQISLVCNERQYGKGNKTIDEDAITFFEEVAPSFSNVLWQCMWLNQNLTCDSLMTPILTEEGICFTFNMLDRDELFTDVVSHTGNYSLHGAKSLGWTIEKGYPPTVGVHTYPRRAVGAGKKACFSLLMTLYEPDLDHLCKGAVQGFKILLHSPAETPRVSQRYFRAPLDQEVVVSIKPEMMTTAEELMNYDPHSRNCYFASERQLKYYQIYSQRNCEVECLTNLTLQKCDCVAFYMPHEEGTPLCGSGSVECMDDAQSEMVENEVKLSIETFEDVDHQPQRGCDCLPACTSLAYNAESSQADFNWVELFQAYHVNFSEFPGVAMTRVYLFFKEEQFITSERNELYGITDFLGNCGGLLGLFIGFSFLSVIEILYFLTLRLICNIKMYGIRFWSGSSELLDNYDSEH